jgi:alpha-glucosidase
MRVIIDFVPNHTSSEHNWFLESRASRDNSKRDWYIWRDPKPDGAPPNNWLSLFGGPAWEWDEITWQYYLHSFLKEQPDLNWRNPQVQEAMFNQARFWLERGVDGFRVDAAHHIMKDPELRDNPPGEPRNIGGKKLAHEYQQHTHDREHPDLHRVYSDFRKLLDSYSEDRPRAAFAEIHVSGGWEAWCAYYGQALDEFHFPFNPAFIALEWNAQKVRQVIDEIEATLPQGAWPNYHTGNFDEWRVVTRYGAAAARTAAMLLFTLRGTPMIYYGEEIGMTNVPIPPEYERDLMGKRIGLNRDPQRTPMQWAPSPHAGFSAHTTPSLWLPVSSNYRTLNVETQLADPRSILNLYRELIAVRRATPALCFGSYRPLDGVPEDVYAYLRELDGERLLAAINFAGEPRRVSLADYGQGEVRLNTYLDRKGPIDLAQFELGAHEGLLIKLAAAQDNGR